MSRAITEMTNLADLSSDNSLSPFAPRLSPLLTETLRELKKDRERHGTKLVATFVVWLVLGLTLRRDKNCQGVLDWLISGWRWLSCTLPKQLVSEGAISHARVRLGVEVFQSLFNRLVATFAPLPPDFHGWVSVAFDGSTGSMPDSPRNRDYFLLRELMLQAAEKTDKDPLALSFLNSLQMIIDAVPQMGKPMAPALIAEQQQYLLDLLAAADLDRPRRPRVNDRVVKVKMSKFKRKTSKPQTRSRDIEQSLEILTPAAA